MFGQSQDDELEEKPVETPAVMISSGTVSNMSNKILSPTEEEAPSLQHSPSQAGSAITALRDRLSKSGGVPTAPPAQISSPQRTPQIRKREADKSWENYER